MSQYGGFGAFGQVIDQLRTEQAAKLNQVAAYARGRAEEQSKRLAELSQAIDQVKAYRSVGGSAPGVVRIEDIPGRRIPFTMLIDIMIGAGSTSLAQDSVQVSQEGPFVAVRRLATFMSTLEFQVDDDGDISRFTGRSYGRYRPIHSVTDYQDAQFPNEVDSVAWSAITGAPANGLFGTPPIVSATSSFRTMEFDGRLVVVNAGSSFPRQNKSVPSPFWSQETNTAMDLAALDFFERGETMTIQVVPNHVNNPPAGNVDGEAIFGTGNGWPFLAGQYDQHEGILTTGAWTVGSGQTPATSLEADPVTRLPNGVLTVGWEGYRIIQPAGA